LLASADKKFIENCLVYSCFTLFYAPLSVVIIMTIEKQRHYLLYGNRAVIYVASLIGLFYDINFAYVIALTLWLWLPQCILLELSLLKAIKH